MGRIILSEGPLWRCGEKEEIVGWLDFLVFKKFAVVGHYGLSRKGKRCSDEIPAAMMQPSLEYKHQGHQGAAHACVISWCIPGARGRVRIQQISVNKYT